MTGRPPQSREMKAASGADKRNKQRLKNNPMPDKGRPVMSKLVKDDPIAKKRWESICSDLESMKVLTIADGYLLEIHCLDYSQYVHLRAVCKNGNISLMDDKGQERPSPESKDVHRYADRIMKQLSELGLTPSARARLHVKQEEEADEFAEWLRGGGASDN